eukprot:gene5488-5481_t
MGVTYLTKLVLECERAQKMKQNPVDLAPIVRDRVVVIELAPFRFFVAEQFPFLSRSWAGFAEITRSFVRKLLASGAKKCGHAKPPPCTHARLASLRLTESLRPHDEVLFVGEPFPPEQKALPLPRPPTLATA